jgi:hypothetical protein
MTGLMSHLQLPRTIDLLDRVQSPEIGPCDERMSEGGYTLRSMNAAEHWQAWLERYAADYATDEERRAAYRDFKDNLATLTEVFSNKDRGL